MKTFLKIFKIIWIIMIPVMAILWILNNGGYEPIILLIQLVITAIDFLKNRFEKDKKIDNGSTGSTNFLSEPVLTLKISKSEIRDTPNSTEYIFQINLAINSYGRKTHIVKMILESDTFVVSRQRIELNFIYQMDNKDYLSLPIKECFDAVKRLQKTPVCDVIIENDEWKYFMLIGSVTGERLSDGYENFHCNGWNLIVTYNDQKVTKMPFDFSIHYESQKTPTAYRYKNFDV